MAVELATAYVSLTVSARGIKQSIENEIGKPLEQSARTSGTKSGDAFSKEFKAKVKDAAGVAGVGLGLALTKGYVDNLSIEKGNDKLAAQLGLVGDEAASAGRAAGSLYSDAYGDSLGQVNEAIRGVEQNIDGFRGASADALEGVTSKVLAVADAFDQDLGGVTAAVGQLMRTGLAKDADEALDVITRGFQSGADKAGDLLDTFTEYGTQFRKLGLDAKTATGILSQGLKAGARDADIVADALKEFSIRAVDGTDAVAAGFDMLGLSGQAMARAVAGGGPSAANALQVTLDRLRAIKDPTLQAQAAVALFGTQAEDLGAALLAIDPRAAVDSLGQVAGAAKILDAQLSGNTATSLEAFKRKFELAFAGLGDKIGPVLSVAPALGGLAQVTDTVGPAMARAGAAVSGFVREVGFLRAGLVGGGVTAAIALVAVELNAMAASSARAKARVAELTKDLKPNDIESYSTAIAALRKDFEKLQADAPSGRKGIIGVLRETAQNMGPWQNTFSDFGDAVDKVARREAELVEAQGRLRANLDALRQPLGLANDDIVRLATAAGIDLTQAFDNDMIPALRKAQVAAVTATTSSKALGDAQGLLASKVTTSAEKLDAFKSALDAALGSQIGAYEATTRLAGTTAELAAAYAEAGGKADLGTEAGLRLRGALAAQVSATGDQIEALIESGGLTADATARTNDYIGKLEALKRQYPALGKDIDGFIAKLRLIPPEQTTALKVDTTQATAAVLSLRSLLHADFGGLSVATIPQRAEGGPVQAGRAYVVGEDRPELFVPRTSGYILPQVPSGSPGPAIGQVSIDARGIPQVDRLADYVGRHVGWRLSAAGRV